MQCFHVWEHIGLFYNRRTFITWALVCQLLKSVQISEAHDNDSIEHAFSIQNTLIIAVSYILLKFRITGLTVLFSSESRCCNYIHEYIGSKYTARGCFYCTWGLVMYTFQNYITLQFWMGPIPMHALNCIKSV